MHYLLESSQSCSIASTQTQALRVSPTFRRGPRRKRSWSEHRQRVGTNTILVLSMVLNASAPDPSPLVWAQQVQQATRTVAPSSTYQNRMPSHTTISTPSQMQQSLNGLSYEQAMHTMQNQQQHTQFIVSLHRVMTCDGRKKRVTSAQITSSSLLSQVRVMFAVPVDVR